VSARVCVVTGAARGLGLEIVRLLAGRGDVVVATDVDTDALAAAIRDLGASVAGRPLDVRDPDACTALAAAVVADHGRLDVWVNNAGILATGPSFELDLATQRRVIEINTFGTMNGTLAALSPMRDRGRGSIVNVVSLAGLAPVPGMAAYSASKHAALAFSLSTLGELRATGARNISISCLCPAGIWTPMLHDRTDDFWASAPFGGRLLQSTDVAARAVALIDRPQPVAAVPRLMGPFSRLTAATPRLATALTPLALRLAAAQQRRTAKRLAAG
jgi:NAD(P)-dependent dehydrogenase (short-subunit alcohol dehydrogenase family)